APHRGAQRQAAGPGRGHDRREVSGTTNGAPEDFRGAIVVSYSVVAAANASSHAAITWRAHTSGLTPPVPVPSPGSAMVRTTSRTGRPSSRVPLHHKRKVARAARYGCTVSGGSVSPG